VCTQVQKLSSNAGGERCVNWLLSFGAAEKSSVLIGEEERRSPTGELGLWCESRFAREENDLED
jgi:hypothetical protein